MNKWFVGVDIGGTSIKMAFITTLGDVVTKWELKTNCEDNGRHIPRDIARALIEKLDEIAEDKGKLLGMGVGAPGFINMETGLIYRAINIGWVNFPLKDLLENETNVPVVVDNDANLAALGEMWRGAGAGAKEIVAVTLGTGVGGGIITNGEIVHGVNGMAGEIGHITSIANDGALCMCGKSGCLETVASATGIARMAMERITKNNSKVLYTKKKYGILTAKDVFDAAKQGDELALMIVDEVGFHLGLALANLCNSFNPQKIVIGGGVSKAGVILLDAVKKHFDLYALPRVKEASELKIAKLENDAGFIGAAWLIKKKILNENDGKL